MNQSDTFIYDRHRVPVHEVSLEDITKSIWLKDNDQYIDLSKYGAGDVMETYCDGGYGGFWVDSMTCLTRDEIDYLITNNYMCNMGDNPWNLFIQSLTTAMNRFDGV